ncbi:Sec-independent protein translocase subunit TatA/TatB [Botrimarina mediterranea]|uniref:Sec-independent protein translocase protein TatA n=1 Tax=Botrimarina mediterranea TaxID=2528022 RepID=A0A518KC48_9BACT|nr:twin-arginine translocase TatA/TatE family subunit [Botrimarina mediterranea]QDV75372.1 twin arginine translocase protein A [Botrimarina mediterranea]QDV80042.1 twin arginine translocase protein A [Planctomycetes bacterium K2D]
MTYPPGRGVTANGTATLSAMFGIGPVQLLVVLVIALLLFGTRLPSIARAFGQSITEFKKGVKEVEDHSNEPQK